MKTLARLDEKSRIILTRHIKAGTAYQVNDLGGGAIRITPYVDPKATHNPQADEEEQ